MQVVLTEFVVIIALMGAGLKLDWLFEWRRWNVTCRLLAITMPIRIVAIAATGGLALGMGWIGALLLGAALAPTDPVLAANAQVGPPRTEEEEEVRFGLTSEAGLNDGLAFPFVNLAIALSLTAANGEPWVRDWLLTNLLWEIGVGVLGGWIIGKLFGWLTFHIPAEPKVARTGDGLIARVATLVSSDITEIIHCHGFLVVFVVALTLRRSHRDHEFHQQMHAITEQLGRLAMMMVLLLFGSTLVHDLLSPLIWVDWVVAIAIIMIVRPLAGLIGLIGFRAATQEKLTLAFGIRGVGSSYYLAFARNHGPFVDAERLWALAGLVVLLSILPIPRTTVINPFNRATSCPQIVKGIDHGQSA